MVQKSKKAVVAALFGNLGIAVFKVIAALFSGSSTMLAEGYHSLSDTLNQILLLYGLKRSLKKPDKKHPFGHGKEQFFWSFVVAIILFGVAGTLSIREGLYKCQHPQLISHVGLIYLAIVIGLIFEGYSFRIAGQNIRREMREEEYKNIFTCLRKGKDQTNLTVFVEDLLALTGLLIAALAITAVLLTGIIIIDAIASVIIGVLLMTFALFLAIKSKGLLLGEGVSSKKRKEILQIVKSFPGIEKVISLKTMHLGPEEVLVTLEINYFDNITVSKLEKINDSLESLIKKIIPEAKNYLEAENRGET